MQSAPEAAKRISLVHYFRKFTFLNAEGVDLEDLKMRFSEYPEHLNFDLAPKSLSPGEQEERQLYNYFKFCKLVAHSYVDELDRGHERDFQTWQYSLTSNKKPNPNAAVQYMQIQLEFSPLTMKITKTNNTLSRFLINMCGIVGGVFVIYGMLNSLVQELKKSVLGLD